MNGWVHLQLTSSPKTDLLDRHFSCSACGKQFQLDRQQSLPDLAGDLVARLRAEFALHLRMEHGYVWGPDGGCHRRSLRPARLKAAYDTGFSNFFYRCPRCWGRKFSFTYLATAFLEPDVDGGVRVVPVAVEKALDLTSSGKHAYNAPVVCERKARTTCWKGTLDEAYVFWDADYCDNSFPEELAALRETKNMTETAAAKWVGVTLEEWQAMEAGERLIDIGCLRRLGQAKARRPSANGQVQRTR